MTDTGPAWRRDGQDTGSRTATAQRIRDHLNEVAAAHRAHLDALAKAEQCYLELRAGLEAASGPPPPAGPAALLIPRHAPPPGQVDPPAVACSRRSFDTDSLRALWEGRVLDCFGPGFEWAESHTRTPRIGTGERLLLARVTDFDVAGGPFGRGYLRAVLPADNPESGGGGSDGPAATGPVILQAAAQAMGFYVTALGYTLPRDGWRFEPIEDGGASGGLAEPGLRGDVVIELHVHEVREEPIPLLRATYVCIADGKPVFRRDGAVLRLLPAWPLDTMPHLVPPIRRDRRVARIGDFPLDERAVMACAIGRPSDAFGEFNRPLDGPRKAPRLPAPPLTCLSRIVRVDRPLGELVPGMEIEAELDIPPDAWYFGDGGNDTMPFCLLLEAAMQPAGALTCLGGVAISATEDLHLRNLDGRCTVHGEVRPRLGTQHLRTVVRLTRVARSGPTTIVSFRNESDVDGVPILSGETVFGVFTRAGLAVQRGLPHVPAEETTPLEPVGDAALHGPAAARLAGGRLRMLDRVTGYWPQGGRHGLGRIRAERGIKPGDWYFKAHFFQDPVQPGSLGLEAVLQLLKSLALRRGLHSGMEAPRFEPVALGRELVWKYRGQVLPSNDLVTVEAEVTAFFSDGRGSCIIADGRLWVDGVCIYEASGLGVRVVEDVPSKPTADRGADLGIEVLDPAVDRWVLDHCPTYGVPALPLMSMVERLAAAALRSGPDRVVIGLEDFRVERWLTLDAPRRLRTDVRGGGDAREATLSTWRDARRGELSGVVPIARARVLLADEYGDPPAELPPLEDPRPRPLPYDEAGALPHGPAFQVMVALEDSSVGATARLDAGAGGAPTGILNQVLLDGLVHGIPLSSPRRWWPEIARGMIGVPYRIPYLKLYGRAPMEGEVLCQIRADGFDGGARFPAARIQCLAEGRVWLELRLVMILLPNGLAFGMPAAVRSAFMRDRAYVPGVGLSRLDEESTVLTLAELRAADWLAGTVARTYGVDEEDPVQLARAVVLRDHVGRLAEVHPSRVAVRELRPAENATPEAPARAHAIPRTQPLARYPVIVETVGESLRAGSDGAPWLDFDPLLPFWQRTLGTLPSPVQALYTGLARQFVGRVVLDDPDAIDGLQGRSVLFLANHQVQIESPLFSFIASGLLDTLTVAISGAKHRTRWIGSLHEATLAWPGVHNPANLLYFDQRQQATLPPILDRLRLRMERERASLLVHVEGALQRSAGRPVERMSSLFIDLCIATAAPIIPVRFARGLPAAPAGEELQLPLEYGRQDYHLGRPLQPEELAALPYAERKRVVLAALNGVGPPLAEEKPAPPDDGFGRAVERWRREHGLAEVQAALLATMATSSDPTLAALVAHARSGSPDAGALAGTTEPEREWFERMVALVIGPSRPS
jgi:3-hydroxymyristoyl/3-hydroxydecanoyl-(acyl carrier protein) dehydratase